MRSWFPLIAVLAYFALVLALPLAVAALRHGCWAMTFHRQTRPWQRVMAWAFALLLLGVPTWGLLLGLCGPAALGVWDAPSAVGVIGAVLALGGTMLTLAAQWRMGASWRIGLDDRPTALVTTGLYRWMRNPIFTGMLLSLGGFALLSPAVWTLVGWLLTALAIAAQVRVEERHLATAHGPAWTAYAARTGRFMPGLGRLVFGKAD